MLRRLVAGADRVQLRAMSTNTRDRVAVTAGERRLGVSIQIGEVVVTIAGPAPPGAMERTEEQVRSAALRLASRALEVAHQEIAQEQS